MIRFSISIIVLILVMTSIVWADKAGEVMGDTLYVDHTYNFSMQFNDAWKIKKIGDDDDIRRFFIIKRSPVVPNHFMDDKSYFTSPMMTVLVEETELSIDSIIKLIRIQKDEDSDLLDEALDNFALITPSRNEPQFGPEREFKVGEYKGKVFDIRKEYNYNIEPRGGGPINRVHDFIIGSIYVLKKGNVTFLIQEIAEKERYGFNEREFKAMVMSIKDLSENKEAEPTKEVLENERE